MKLRIAARRMIIEAPSWVRDFAPDLVDRTLPPRNLRRRVSRTGGRKEFVDVGAMAAGAIRRAWSGPGGRPWRVLDFGCGPGRVARLLAPEVDRFAGVDVDADAIAWCAEHLEGTFHLVDRLPPLPFADASFDFVYAISVFTHFDEPVQDRWLAELRRVLMPGGWLFATTHSPALVFDRPDLADGQRVRLANEGFAFAPGRRTFSEDSAFHDVEYVRSHWARWFTLVHFEPFGLGGFQDVAVLRANG